MPDGADISAWEKAAEAEAASAAAPRQAESKGESRSGTANLTLVIASELLKTNPPDRQWLVPDIVPRGTVTLLSGDGSTGKSLLAMQLAAAVAAGRQWLDFNTAHGGALYLSAEDDIDEMHRRLKSICRDLDIDRADLDKLALLPMAGQNAELMSEVSGKPRETVLARKLEKLIARKRPALVVLDTSADVYGGNENDRPAVRRFVGMLRKWAQDGDSAMLLLSHPSLTGISSGTGLSGSTAWHNSVRSRLYLTRVREPDGSEIDPNLRHLNGMKANYAALPSQQKIRWSDGVFRQSGALDRSLDDAMAEKTFLKLLRAFTNEGRRVRPSAGNGYAPTVFHKSGRAKGLTKHQLVGAMERLLARGTIVIGEDGSPSRRVKFLVEAG